MTVQQQHIGIVGYTQEQRGVHADGTWEDNKQQAGVLMTLVFAPAKHCAGRFITLIGIISFDYSDS